MLDTSGNVARRWGHTHIEVAIVVAWSEKDMSTLSKGHVKAKTLSNLMVGPFFASTDINEVEEWSSGTKAAAKLCQISHRRGDSGR